MKYNIDELSSKLSKIEKVSRGIDYDEKIKKYGTFLDSKKEMIQLYVLFIFFGIHGDFIKQLEPKLSEYDPD